MYTHVLKVRTQIPAQLPNGSFVAPLDGLAATVQFFTNRYQALALTVDTAQ